MDQNIRQNTDMLVAVAALANVGKAGQAIKLLGDQVVEAKEPAAHAAHLWLGLGEADRMATAVFASGRSSRAIINQRIQDGLAAEGSLKGEGVHLTVFEQVNLTREELRYASGYRVGQTLDVGRGGARDVGLAAGRYDVTKVGRRVELRDAAGRRLRFDPQRLSPMEKRDRLQLAERKDIHLREGDRIRWTANDKGRGIHNAGLARIIGISDAGVMVEMGGKEPLLLKPTDPMLSRLDLAYALNMHMAQGITTDKAITVMSSDERNLANQRLFNVGVTRVRDELTLVVDDKEKLQRQLDTNPGNKTSALETLGRMDIDPDRKSGGATSSHSRSAPPVQLGLPDVSPRGERATAEGKAGVEQPIGGKAGRKDDMPLLPERSLGLDL